MWRQWGSWGRSPCQCVIDPHLGPPHPPTHPPCTCPPPARAGPPAACARTQRGRPTRRRVRAASVWPVWPAGVLRSLTCPLVVLETWRLLAIASPMPTDPVSHAPCSLPLLRLPYCPTPPQPPPAAPPPLLTSQQCTPRPLPWPPPLQAAGGWLHGPGGAARPHGPHGLGRRGRVLRRTQREWRPGGPGGDGTLHSLDSLNRTHNRGQAIMMGS